MVSLVITFGNGLDYGNGCTYNWATHAFPPTVETWVGVWKTMVYSFSLYWNELGTVKSTLLRIKILSDCVDGFHLIYFTDNQATYDICQKSYSSKDHLMSLVCEVHLL